MNAPLSRWRIEGQLMTKTMLRIGSGDVDLRPELRDDEKADPVQVNAVLLDHAGKPYLPGSSLKGVLRGWLNRSGCNAKVLAALMGSGEQGDADARGGCIEVEDAFLAADRQLPEHTMWQSPARHTGVRAGIARDVDTLTVLEDRLFHDEYVPPGSAFELHMIVDTDDPTLIEWLLAALAAFATDPQMRIGADTGKGCGRIEWTKKGVAQFGRDQVASWLTRLRTATVGPVERWDREPGHAPAITARIPAAADPRWKAVDLALQFDSPFLVNHPEAAIRKKRKTGKEAKDDTSTNFNPRRLVNGHVYLPGASLKGALRAQAERILRTLDVHACDRRNPCPPRRDPGDEDRLCHACRVFGAAGWGSLVRCDDLLARARKDHVQGFVAIDRFTGGVAGSAKFNATADECPTLAGKLWLDTERLKPWPWARGLLLLTLRDLLEGDIALGFGRSKGFGALLPSGDTGLLEGIAGCIPTSAPDGADWTHKASLLVQAFRDEINRPRPAPETAPGT